MKIGYLQPDSALNKHAGDVATPSCAVPAGTLVEKPSIICECRLEFGFRAVLDLYPPSMVNHPTGQEVIVIGGSQGYASEPNLVRKTFDKGAVEENMGPVGRSPS